MFDDEYKSICVKEMRLGEFEIAGIKGKDVYTQVLPEALSAVKRLKCSRPVKVSIGRIELFVTDRITIRELVAYFEKEYLWETGMMVD